MFSLHKPYAEKGVPAWSWLVATLNDSNVIAVVLFCLIALLVTAGGLRYEMYRATHPDGVERPGQVVAGSRERAELQALFRQHVFWLVGMVNASCRGRKARTGRR